MDLICFWIDIMWTAEIRQLIISAGTQAVENLILNGNSKIISYSSLNQYLVFFKYFNNIFTFII